MKSKKKPPWTGGRVLPLCMVPRRVADVLLFQRRECKRELGIMPGMVQVYGICGGRVCEKVLRRNEMERSIKRSNAFMDDLL